MFNPETNLVNISNEEYKQYAQHMILEHVGLQGQKRIKKGKILIIGAGGLGCPALLYLTASGIGLIGIIDNDEISYSNLNRQILYNHKNIKNKKVLAAKKQLQEINPKCKIITHLYYLNKKNSTEIIKYYDIIIDATDNFQIRYIIDQICYKLHKIHIYGGIEEFEGQVAILNYKSGIRYSNIYCEDKYLQNNNCNRHGVLGITSGFIGILQATEALKIILGINQVTNNCVLLCNLLNTCLKQKKIYISSKTPFIKNNLTSEKQVLSNKKIILQQNIEDKKYIIFDIRNKHEFKHKHIKTSINIPLKYFKLKKTINFIKNHCQDNITLGIYCNTSNKSLIASHILDNNQIKNFIIKAKRIN